MTQAATAVFVDADVFALTVSGKAQLDESETGLSREALELLVLVDGRASAGQLTRAVPGLTPDRARETLAELLADGYLRPVKPSEPAPYIDFLDFTSPHGLPDDIPDSPDDSKRLSTLEQAGYYVRIARKAKSAHLAPGGRRPVALVVDDDADICTLLKTYLKLEDFDVVVAGNRAEVVAAFRRQTPFDLVLLDVQLPDVDGFAILAKIRQHPALKDVPIIMLTASATRAAVLKGLHYGADGYVTKPFQHDALMKAVRTVLGIEEADPMLATTPGLPIN